MYSAENVAYLKGVLGKKIVGKVVNGKILSPGEKGAGFRVKHTLEKMEKYGDNRWWLSKDDEKVLRCQVAEPMLIISVERFISLVNQKLGTNIQNEIELSNKRDWIRSQLAVRCS